MFNCQYTPGCIEENVAVRYTDPELCISINKLIDNQLSKQTDDIIHLIQEKIDALHKVLENKDENINEKIRTSAIYARLGAFSSEVKKESLEQNFQVISNILNRLVFLQSQLIQGIQLKEALIPFELETVEAINGEGNAYNSTRYKNQELYLEHEKNINNMVMCIYFGRRVPVSVDEYKDLMLERYNTLVNEGPQQYADSLVVKGFNPNSISSQTTRLGHTINSCIKTRDIQQLHSLVTRGIESTQEQFDALMLRPRKYSSNFYEDMCMARVLIRANSNITITPKTFKIAYQADTSQQTMSPNYLSEKHTSTSALFIESGYKPDESEWKELLRLVNYNSCEPYFNLLNQWIVADEINCSSIPANEELLEKCNKLKEKLNSKSDMALSYTEAFKCLAHLNKVCAELEEKIHSTSYKF